MTLVAKAAALCAELELSDKLSAADTINSAAQYNNNNIKQSSQHGTKARHRAPRRGHAFDTH